MIVTIRLTEISTVSNETAKNPSNPVGNWHKVITIWRSFLPGVLCWGPCLRLWELPLERRSLEFRLAVLVKVSSKQNIPTFRSADPGKKYGKIRNTKMLGWDGQFQSWHWTGASMLNLLHLCILPYDPQRQDKSAWSLNTSSVWW